MFEAFHRPAGVGEATAARLGEFVVRYTLGAQDALAIFMLVFKCTELGRVPAPQAAAWARSQTAGAAATSDA